MPRPRATGATPASTPGRAVPLPSASLLLSLLALATLHPTITSASLLSSHHPLRGDPVLARRAATVPSFSNSTQVFPSVSTTTTTEGRYGHSALYLSSSNTLLFIGGQVGSNGTSITNDVLSFNLASTFLWGARPISAIPDNPASNAALSEGLPPTAWAASALDNDERVWMLGGVTENCETDGMAYVLGTNSSTPSWSTPTLEPRAPPRRRQAQALAVANSTTLGTDVYVFGGIAEPYTCSEETIGYLGVDRYDTKLGTVESFAWEAPGNIDVEWFAPPVSDYTATMLADGKSVAIVGGQTAQGKLAKLGSVLVFDTETKEWTSRIAVGDVPLSRMGHVAIPLSSGSIIIHGGLGVDQRPLSDLHLLTPPTSAVESALATSVWTWSTLVISNHSMSTPSRAWHTATSVPGDTVVVAFGIDTEKGAPSNDFWFLTLDEEDGTYTWADTFEGNGDAFANLHHGTATYIISNPKNWADVSATTTSESVTEEPSSTTISFSSAAEDDNADDAPTSSTRLASSSIVPKVTSSILTNASKVSVADEEEAAAASKKQRTIAAAVGSLLGLVALVGVGAVLLRRRNSNKARKDEPPTPSTFTAPFVSTLHYARPAPQRNLSLGSSVSAPHSPAMSEDDYGTSSSAGSISSIRAVLGPASSQDPFSDQHRVTELGQLQAMAPVAAPPGRASSLLANFSPSVASVTSIPFLAALTRTTSTTDENDDAYTVRAPTIGSRRSMRSHSSNESSESNVTQEFGVAVSSGATPGPPPFLEFVRPEPLETMFDGGRGGGGGTPKPEMQEVVGNATGATIRSVSSRTGLRKSSMAESVVPGSLRPGTPLLRVTNPEEQA